MKGLCVVISLISVLIVFPVLADETGDGPGHVGGNPLDSRSDASSKDAPTDGDDKPSEGAESAEDENSGADEGQKDGSTTLDLSPSSFTYPTLAHRELGQPVVDTVGQPKVWPHKLPVWGKKITSMGIDLPDPYGVSLIGTYVSQDIVVEDLRVSFDDGQTYQPFPWVQFPDSSVASYSFETKVDAWILPFMNLYAIAGYVDGDGDVPIGLPVEPLLDTLGFGVLCPDNILRPDFCDDVVLIDVQTDFSGYNVGVGTVLAMGWKSWYAAFPITYVWSEMSNLEQTIGTLTVETLFGHTFELRGEMKIEAFIGASYLDANHEITDTYSIPLSDLSAILDDVDIDYKVLQSNTDKWAFVAGGQFQFSKEWAMQCQIAYASGRQQYTLSGVRRW